MLQFNDIHGHVIKTKPTELFRGSGQYKRKLAISFAIIVAIYGITVHAQ